MRTKKRNSMAKILWMAVIVLLSLLLAACSGGEEAASTPSPPASQDSRPADSSSDASSGMENSADEEDDLFSIREEPIELFFAQTSNGGDQATFDEQFGNKLKELLPHYTFTFKGREGSGIYESWVASGEQIDILRASIGHTPSMVLSYDLQQDISDLIEKYNYDLDKLEPSTIEAQRQYGGEIYALPINTTSLALFYNKDIFDTFGVKYPREGMTWDEVHDLAREMTRVHEGRQIRGMTMAFNYMLFLNQLSVPHFEPGTHNPSFTSDEFTKVFENFSRFFRIPGNEMTNGKYSLNDMQNPFREGNVAMLMTLSTANFEDHINWDLVQLPHFEEKMGIGPQSYPTYFYITNLTKNRDAAFQVLMAATSEEYQRFLAETGRIPILKDSGELLKDFAKDNPFLRDKNIQAIIPEVFAAPTEKTRYQGLADAQLFRALEDYAAGTDVNTALREAEERVRQEIAAQEGN